MPKRRRIGTIEPCSEDVKLEMEQKTYFYPELIKVKALIKITMTFLTNNYYFQKIQTSTVGIRIPDIQIFFICFKMQISRMFLEV